MPGPQVSLRTLYRRVWLVAIWRRPKLTARGDPEHCHVVAGIVGRLIELPILAVVFAEDETHPHLMPRVRASFTLRTVRLGILTPGTNPAGHHARSDRGDHPRLGIPGGHRRAAGFIALLSMLDQAFPQALVIVAICDNDSSCHACKVTAYLKEHPAGTDLG